LLVSQIDVTKKAGFYRVMFQVGCRLMYGLFVQEFFVRTLLTLMAFANKVPIENRT